MGCVCRDGVVCFVFFGGYVVIFYSLILRIGGGGMRLYLVLDIIVWGGFGRVGLGGWGLGVELKLGM